MRYFSGFVLDECPTSAKHLVGLPRLLACLVEMERTYENKGKCMSHEHVVICDAFKLGSSLAGRAMCEQVRTYVVVRRTMI
jgi:hypothetical protein